MNDMNDQESGRDADQAPPTTYDSWLARDFVEYTSKEGPWDVVIVGSGYGAAMAAHTWAGCKNRDGNDLHILMLERGREYLPGAFPSSLDELPGHVRISRAGKAPIGRREALFDVRLAGDVSALVGNGLGGGSLINAGVIVEPSFGTFDSRFPPGVEADLQSRWYAQARRMLGAEVPSREMPGDWVANTIHRHPEVTGQRPLKKTEALKGLQRDGINKTSPTPITVRLNAADNQGQAASLHTCTLCGDCLTGCNVGAKASLDAHLLIEAKQAGLEIFTSTSVLRLGRVLTPQGHKLWEIEACHTDPLVQARRGDPVKVLTHRVVLAAGSLGSTEILLRSRSTGQRERPVFSARLGEQFSLNGDNTAFIHFREPVDATADEKLPLDDGNGGPSPRRVGPEITQALAWPASDAGPGFQVQEFSVPAALRGLFQEVVTTRSWLEDLQRAASEVQRDRISTAIDPMAIDEEAMKQVLMVGLIGHDSATGRILLPRGPTDEGSVAIQWKDVGQDPAMAAAFEQLKTRIQDKRGTKLQLIPNPLWRLLPDQLSKILGGTTGSAMTVHPLGGCPMGDSKLTGVVDSHGVVFNAEPDDRRRVEDNWEGSLLVLDGAIVPASLGANPALTIAALSLRAAEEMRRRLDWQPTPKPSESACDPNTQVDPRPRPRPRARSLRDCQPRTLPSLPTEIQIVERLVGRVNGMLGPTGPGDYMVELTFGFKPIAAKALASITTKHLELDTQLRQEMPSCNTLRIYPHAVWKDRLLDSETETERMKHAEVVALMTGSLEPLVSEASNAFSGTGQTLLAYLRNRGLRDVRRGIEAWLRSQGSFAEVKDWIDAILKLATHAGEVRCFKYDATITALQKVANPLHGEFWQAQLVDRRVLGHKRFTYACEENPWNQLLYLNLDAIGNAWKATAGAEPIRLKLDARFLAGQGLPLLRITRQENQVRALADLMHLGLYFTRLFLKLHLLHLRQPDPPSSRSPQRLPGTLRGLPPPEITEIELEPGLIRTAKPPRKPESKMAAAVRLTRYRGSKPPPGKPPRPPLVFIHGYSASGTTFAHDAIEHNAARYFWERGRDVWVLDLRTSAGMPTAQAPWAFEDVAWADIPVAIEHIAARVGHERSVKNERVAVDVFAHCIGAVMLSMALLTRPTDEDQSTTKPTRYTTELDRLRDNINRLVLSQKGFYVEYSDANLLRSYILNFIKPALQGGYHFRPPDDPRLRDRLLDAFLATLPYPHHEWRREHPLWRNVPWSATRRRMDALYERTFNLENMPDQVLQKIDDLFGPLNLETVAQTIHFARKVLIAKSNGDSFAHRPIGAWPLHGTLLISSRDNGMVNPNTTQFMANALQLNRIPVERLAPLSGGHQDILIGQQSRDIWREVERFLNESN